MNDNKDLMFNLRHMAEEANFYQPRILQMARTEDKEELAALFETDAVNYVSDTIEQQFYEYLESKDPSVVRRQNKLKQEMEDVLNGQPIESFGNWIYYPWSKSLVHLLPEHMYREARFSRNLYKITREEQDRLGKLRIGIVGLSTGRACAQSLALEGIGGSYRLADHDSLSLSNLNRIQTGIHNLEINKSVLAARSIYELNPYSDVTAFMNGLDKKNLDNFLCYPQKLDIIIEECDDIFMKFKLREEARRHRIPVMMATSERGMIDIERFDSEPGRAIFHGLVGNIDSNKLNRLSTEEKIPYVIKIIGSDNMSDRSTASMVEIGESTSSFAQLASNVLLGGATIADVVRRVFLGELSQSGRYYVDLNEIINDNASPPLLEKTPETESEEENCSDAPVASPAITIPRSRSSVSNEEVKSFVSLATMAPSGGNCQPWYFKFKNRRLFCYHDESRSRSFLDFNHHASYMAFGALAENLLLTAKAFGRTIDVELFPDENVPNLIYTVSLGNNAQSVVTAPLFEQIPNRVTNRRIGKRVRMSEEDKYALLESADFDSNELRLLTTEDELAQIGDILGEADRIRMLNRTMHTEMMNEMRWNRAESFSTRDGIDLATLELSGADEAGIRMISSYGAMSFLNKFGLGRTLRRFAKKSIDAASGVGLVTSEGANRFGFFNGGRAVQRTWLTATARGLAIQPMTTITYLFDRLEQGEGVGFSKNERKSISDLREQYLSLFGPIAGRCEAMLFRIAKVDSPSERALRRPVDDVLTIE